MACLLHYRAEEAGFGNHYDSLCYSLTKLKVKKKDLSFSVQIIDMINLVNGLENATLRLRHLVSVLQNLVSVIFF